MRPVREITAEQENFRLSKVEGASFESIKRDFIEPEPVGTILLMAFRVTGYDRDCDGSAMVRAEHINKDGDCSGWNIDSIGLYPNTDLVVTQEELTSLFNDAEDPYTVDASHTDPTEKETALCLKYRQRARAAEAVNKELRDALEEIRKHAYKGIVMTIAHKALDLSLDKHLESTLMTDKD